jgi:protein TonB
LRKAFLVGTLLVILAAIGWLVRPYLQLNRQSGPAPEAAAAGAKPTVYSPLSLWATRSDKVVTITWDSTRPAMSEARVAVLTIKDDNAQRDISLTRNQLEANRFVYISTGETIEISLEVFAPSGKPTVESIMIAAAQPGQTARSRSDSDVVTRREVTPRNTEGIMTPLTAAPTSQSRAPAESSEPPRTFVAAPSPKPVAAQPSLLTDTPAAATGTTSAALKTPDFLASSPLQSPIQPPQSPIQPPPRPTLGPPVTAPMTVEPARPLRQVRPAVPSNVVSLLRRPVDIQVRVSVDEKGKVVRAEPIVPAGGINQYLAATAASTARMWTFQPARRGDTPLSSEVVLTFTFTPTPR